MKFRPKCYSFLFVGPAHITCCCCFIDSPIMDLSFSCCPSSSTTQTSLQSVNLSLSCQYHLSLSCWSILILLHPQCSDSDRPTPCKIRHPSFISTLSLLLALCHLSCSAATLCLDSKPLSSLRSSRKFHLGMSLPSMLLRSPTWLLSRQHMVSGARRHSHTRLLSSLSTPCGTSPFHPRACFTSSSSRKSSIYNSKSGYNPGYLLHRTAGRRWLTSDASPFPPLTSTGTEGTDANTAILQERITRVTTPEAAQQVLKVLYAHPEVYWACDTEVADIDLKAHGNTSQTYSSHFVH